jgi:hypothetical protein
LPKATPATQVTLDTGVVAEDFVQREIVEDLVESGLA